MSKRYGHSTIFAVICFMAGFCMVGSFCGFFRISQALAGHEMSTLYLYYVVVFVSVWVGLLSPQWVIRMMMRTAERARGMLFQHGQEQAYNHVWLPETDRVEFPAVIHGLAGCVLVWTGLAVGGSWLSGGIYHFQEWFIERFLIGPVALRILHGLCLLILLFPAWAMVGVLLALLFRLALSLEEDRTESILPEKRLLLFLLVGGALSCGVWNYWLPHSPGHYLPVWLANLPALIGVVLLMFIVPAQASQLSRPAYEPMPSVMERIVPRSRFYTMIIVLCGMLLGGAIPLWGRLLTLLMCSDKPAGYYYCIFIFLLAGGVYMGGRRSGLGISPRQKIATLFLWFAFMSQLCILITGMFWGSFSDLTMIPPDRLLTVLLYAILSGLMIVSGMILNCSREILVEMSVSPSLGWARWVIRLGVSFIIGWGMVIFLLLSRYGSLMVLSIWILLSLLAGGVMVIYQSRSGRVRRLVLIITGFLLVGLHSLLIPWASQYWLRIKDLASVSVCEDAEGTWLLYRDPADNSAIRSVALRPGLKIYPDITLSDEGRINLRILKSICLVYPYEEMMVIGFNENIWPLSVPVRSAGIDYLINSSLAQRLRKYQVLNTSNIKQRNAVHFIERSSCYWLKLARDTYGTVLLSLTDSTMSWLSEGNNRNYWLALRNLLKPNGIMFIVIKADASSDSISPELLSTLAEVFQWRGGLLETSITLPGTRVQKDLPVMILWPTEEAWEEFITRRNYTLEELPPPRCPITLRYVQGRFTCFSHLL
ncbi:MAG: hypothetical protein JW860_03505 [Sedimentisphaerales bacterium]|nr:hypothetical protein [Sedimentisphaerales bacterium]